MTVKELIAELTKMPQDLPVLVRGEGGAFYKTNLPIVTLNMDRTGVMVG